MSYRGLNRGDPGFFGSALKFVGGAIKGGVSSFITGGNPIAGAVSGGVRSLLAPSTAQPAVLQAMPGGAAPARMLQQPGTAVQGRVSPMGTVGICGPGMRLKKDGGCTTRKRPTMNPMNRRAANRAINRIKGARRILHAIEISLPKRKATGGGGRRGKSCGCK